MKKPILVSYLLVVLLVIGSLLVSNYEFLIYGIVLLPLVWLIQVTDKKFDYNPYALWGFSTWLLLHLMGGLLTFKGIRLYDYIFFELVGEPYNILKYDQILHVYTYVVMAGLIGHIVSYVTKKKANKTILAVIIVLAATGIGGINEILEFLPVAFFNAAGPGGYFNTAIDLIANFIGSIIGSYLYLKD